MNFSLKKLTRELPGFVLQAIILSGFFIATELIFHFMQDFEDSVAARLIYPIGFSLALGCFLTAVFSFFPKAVNLTLSVISMSLCTIWACVQICYTRVFQTYMEFQKVFMGKDVAGNFGDEMADAIISSLPRILLFIALTVIFSLELILQIRPKRKSVPLCLIGLVLAIGLHFGTFGLLYVEGTGAYSPISMYQQNPGILDNNIQNFGVLTSLRLDISGLFFDRTPDSSGDPFQSGDFDILNPDNSGSTDISSSGSSTPDSSSGVPSTGEPSTDEPSTGDPIVPSKTKNTLNFNFDQLLADETDPTLASIHKYVASQSGSNVNSYTGMFEGYNLIMICAESWTSYMISEELTPTLYKMSNNGFVFNNYYGTFKSITTNGEFAFCTGLMPNTVGKTAELKSDSTFKHSVGKYLPYCMGNVFSEMGARTYAYHSNTGSFYDRKETHPNMGYDVVRFLDGSYVDGQFVSSEKLTYTTKRPNSDNETVLQTMKDYLSDVDENGKVKPFHAYYMTYSGHHPYYDASETDKIRNPMVFRNREVVDKLSVSGHVKAYIAANLELEHMVTSLLKGLEEAGCLENTVIVLTNDHYPYGLQTSEFKELANLTGKKVEATYGMYENSFICYNAGMTEKVEVNTPCCTVDIIPTLLNLWGVDYDSRLLAGTDILDPNSFHVAMLYNQSFITDKIRYNTSNGKISYLVDKSEVSQEYIDTCVRYVKNRFEISLQIIENDYYRKLYATLPTSLSN